MCVDSLLLKFNSDENNLPEFLSQYLHLTAFLSSTKDGRPLWWWWALRRLHAGIGMAINHLGHPMSMTQHYFNHK